MDSSRGWWAVYTRHHHEEKVREMLEAKGLDVFHPTYQSPRRWKDRIKVLPMPLFPCYVFVRKNAGAKLPVVSTPGVHTIVTRGEEFAVIPDEEIEAIRMAAQSAARLEPCPYLRVGELVRVVRGPMKGVEGILLRQAGQYRLVLSVDLLSQSASVEVSATDIANPEFVADARGTDVHWRAGMLTGPRQATGLVESANRMRWL